MVKRVVEEDILKSKKQPEKKPEKQRLGVKKIQEETNFPKKPEKSKKKSEPQTKTKPITKTTNQQQKISEKKSQVTNQQKTQSRKTASVKKTKPQKTQSPQKKPAPQKKTETQKQTQKKPAPQSSPKLTKKTTQSKPKEKAKELLNLAKEKFTNSTNILKIIIICLIAIILILSLILIIKPSNKSSNENTTTFNNSRNSTQEINPPIKEIENSTQETTKNEINQSNETQPVIEPEPEPPQERIGQLKTFNLIINTTEEELILESNYKKLNLYEKIVDVFRDNIREKELPLFLSDPYTQQKEYKQEIILTDKLLLHDFQEEDYLEGEETTGFIIPNGMNVFTYIIEFDDTTTWADLDNKNIRLFGKNYEVLNYIPEQEKITLIENPLHFDMNKKDIVLIKTLTEEENISVYFMGSDEAILNMSGQKTKKLSKGSELFTDNFYFYTKDVIGIDQDPDGLISMVVSNRIITLEDWIINRPSEEVYELQVDINSQNEFINNITISWQVEQDTFLTSDSNLYLPFFNTIEISMSEEYDVEPEEENSHYYSNYWEVFLEAKSQEYTWQSNQTNLG